MIITILLLLLLLLLLIIIIIKTGSKECISIHLEFCRIRNFLIHKRGRIKGHDFTVIIWEYPRCRLGPSKISGNLKGRFCLYCFVNLVMFIFSTVNACAVRVLEIIALSVAWEKQPTLCNATNGSTRNVTSEESGHKFHTDDSSLPWSGKWFWLTDWLKLHPIRSTVVWSA